MRKTGEDGSAKRRVTIVEAFVGLARDTVSSVSLVGE